MIAAAPATVESSLVRVTSATRLAFGVFLTFFALYAVTAGGHTYSSDEEGMLLSARQLFEERTARVVVNEDNAGLIPAVPGRFGEPVGVSGLAQIVAAAPLLGIGTIVGATVADSYKDHTERLFVGFTNPIVVAAGVALLFAIAVELGSTWRRGLLLATAYGVGTYVWPHSKTFFSEPIATTLVLAAVLFTVKFRRSGSVRHAVGVGFFLAASLLGRSSNGIFIPIVCVYIGAVAVSSPPRMRRLLGAAAAIVAGAATPALVFLGSNWWRFGSPFDLGYPAVPLDYPVLEGLYGLLLSPGKSIFLYAPVVLVGATAAVVTLLKRHDRWPEAALLLGLGGVNLLFFARFPHWHGDHSWGPRYLLMSLPFLVLPAAWMLDRVRWRRAVVATGVVGALLASLGTVMYFNQYFAVAEAALGTGSDEDGPTYWKSLHFDPEWSPLVGHARLLDEVVANSASLVCCEEPEREFLGSTAHRYGWYFAPPQLDSWVYWNLVVDGPRRLFLLIPPIAGLAVVGIRTIRRQLA